MRRFVLLVVAVTCLAVPLGGAAPTHSAAAEGAWVAPTWIAIPAIGIEAAIEEVWIADRQMGVPEDPWNVGWYPELGYVGNDDNVVMSGHVDWWGYGPTVFADLANLGEGDEIVLGGDDGGTYVYLVTETWTVDEWSPREDVRRVFRDTEDEALTLITCTGDFDGEQYAERLIVRAELVEVY
ncbi:MAG: sortase [Thermomicrobiales bacterium]|nr:sortase [Thermomicrobiales bacterium]